MFGTAVPVVVLETAVLVVVFGTAKSMVFPSSATPSLVLALSFCNDWPAPYVFTATFLNFIQLLRVMIGQSFSYRNGMFETVKMVVVGTAEPVVFGTAVLVVVFGSAEPVVFGTAVLVAVFGTGVPS